MSIRERKDTRTCFVDIFWPDHIRTRTKAESEEKGTEIELRAKLSMIDGTWAEYREILAGDKPETDILRPGRFSELIELYFEQYVKVKNRSLKAKSTFLSRFKVRWGKLPPAAIRLTTVDKYVADRHKDGVKNATINRELSCLRHLYSWAQRRGYVDQNPLLLMEKLEEPQWIGKEPTKEAVEAVFAALDERFLPVFTLIRETGARRSEVLGLTRDRVDRERRIATFIQTKTGKVRHVPLTDEALAAIEAVPELPGCPYVFYNPATGDCWSHARKPWEQARKLAGYPWLRVRDLRIAFGTELAEGGLDMDLVCKVLGNTRAVAEKYYTKVSPDSAPRQALRVLNGGRNR